LEFPSPFSAVNLEVKRLECNAKITEGDFAKDNVFKKFAGSQTKGTHLLSYLT